MRYPVSISNAASVEVKSKTQAGTPRSIDLTDWSRRSDLPPDDR
jgi:hypothetical protein